MKNYLIVFTFLLSGLIYAQENTGAELWITFEYTPKMGMNQKFESAIAEKTKLFNKADNSAVTAVLMTGAEAENGKYERIMPRRTNDWYSQSLSTEETKFWQNNVAKYIKSGEGPYVWERIKNLSINFEETNPTKYYRSLIRVLKNGNNEDFWRYLERYTKVLSKASTPWPANSELAVSQGMVPVYPGGVVLPSPIPTVIVTFLTPSPSSVLLSIALVSTILLLLISPISCILKPYPSLLK